MSEVKVNKITPRTDCGTTQLGDSGDTVTVTGDLRSNSLKATDGGVIISQSGTTITLGASGDTVSLASGASQSGFGRSGSVDWQTTVKTESFTASSGEGYFIDTDDSGSPFKNYAVTVATGTQYIVGGSGNIFQLDGSTQQAITLMKGKTYRFTQTDDTNDGHPLIISTSNSTTLSTFIAGIVSSGVSYYLDGSSNQTNYTNTTTFNAATTRYIEFQPQTTGTFYFGCYVHGIGMGGAITSQNVTLSLPAGVAGAIIAVKDYRNTFDTNNLTISANGSDKIGGSSVDATLETEGIAVTLVFIDSTRGWLVTNDGVQSEAPTAAYIAATGGNTTATCGDFKIHTFTSPGTFCVSNAGNACGSNAVEYIVVGGGGGAPVAAPPGDYNYASGGGGAGGFRFASPSLAPATYPGKPLAAPAGLAVPATAYPITVGGGGAKGQPGSSYASSGSNSIFSSITATGGGRGGVGGNGIGTPGTDSGANGGSGGGSGAVGSANGGSGNTPPVSPAQGKDGGEGTNGGYTAGGGGGGALADGNDGAAPPTPGQEQGGNGGVGAGIPTAFGSSGSPSGGYQYFSGGGGGGATYVSSPQNGTNSTGGTGGGGPGKSGSSSATDGTANTGGGGGGAGAYNGPNNGGSGGSGIVIIRYKFQN